ncbi:MAG: hypothetical protein ACSHYF_14065 [Verrucomicrobiaceae bacterium]
MNNDSKKYTLGLLALASALALASCGSSEPTFGERIASEGTDVAGIGKQWQEGDKMVKKGQDLIEDGEKMQKKGKKTVNKGEDMITKGQKLKAAAEESYRLKPASPAVPVAQ